MINEGLEIEIEAKGKDIILKCYQPMVSLEQSMDTESITESVMDKYDEDTKYAIKFKACFKKNFRKNAMWDLVGEFIVSETKDEKE